MKVKIFLIIVIFIMLSSGCNNINNELPPDMQTEPENNTVTSNTADSKKYFWLIKLEQKNNAPFLGSLGDGSVPSENTIYFVAVNGNESPYEGEFRVAGNIEHFTNLKEEYGIDDAAFLELKGKSTIESCSFMLVPSELNSLTKDKDLDALLQDYSGAEFAMSLKGSPGGTAGLVQDYSFQNKAEAQYQIKCSITQRGGKIELKTDMYGNFTGTIEKAEEGDEDILPEELDIWPEFKPEPLNPPKASEDNSDWPGFQPEPLTPE